MSATFEWNSAPWIAAPKEAMALASNDVRMEAARLARWRHVASSVFLAGGGNEYSVGASAPDANFLEHGTSAHTEAPRNTRALKFKTGGFAKGSVPHPGTAAHPFLEP